MSFLKKLASDTAYYGLSTIVGRMVYYLLVILHTKVFLPAEQAIVIDFFAIVGILNVIYTYGMETAFFRFSTKADNPQKYYHITLTALIISSCVFSGLIMLNAENIAEWRGFPESKTAGSTKYVIWVALILATDAIAAIPFARLRLERKAKRFALIRVANICLNVGLNIFFLWFCRGIDQGEFLKSWQGIIHVCYNPANNIGYIFLANLIANIVMLVMLSEQFLDFRFRFEYDTFRQMLKYGYPILIMGLAGGFNLVADRLMLREFLPENFYPNRSPDEVLGIYGNCAKLAIFMNLAVQAFRYAADPFFFSKAQDKNAPELLAQVMKWFIIVCVFLWVGVSLFLDVFAAVFLKQAIYHEALAIVPILLLANLFLGVYYNLGFWFKLTDKTYFGTFLTFTGLAVNILAAYWLTPRFGYVGCAAAFLFSTILMCVCCYYLGERHYPVPYQIRSAAFYLISAGILIFFVQQIHIPSLFWSIPYHILLFLCYLGVFLVMERKVVRIL